MLFVKILIPAFALVAVLIFSACKKVHGDNEVEIVQEPSNNIIGNWKQTQFYDGFFGGGTFKWNNVDPGIAALWIFKSDSSYSTSALRANYFPASFRHTKNQLSFQYNGGTKDTVRIDKLTQDTLIISKQVTDGRVKLKFLRQN